MPQSFASVHVHVIFSTKDRQPIFDDKSIRCELHAFLGGTSKQLGCPPFIAGGVADHIHLLAQLGRTISIADWVKELKRVSNLWAKDRSKGFSKFEWQRGYAAFP